MDAVINFADKLSRFSEHWSPRVIAQMNDYQFKLVKVKGEFVWHDHPDTDEVFIVLEGELHLQIENASTRILRAGEMTVIPKGTRHCPLAPDEVKIMLVEPAGVVNTGDVESELRAANDVWV